MFWLFYSPVLICYRFREINDYYYIIVGEPVLASFSRRLQTIWGMCNNYYCVYYCRQQCIMHAVYEWNVSHATLGPRGHPSKTYWQKLSCWTPPPPHFFNIVCLEDTPPLPIHGRPERPRHKIYCDPHARWTKGGRWGGVGRRIQTLKRIFFSFVDVWSMADPCPKRKIYCDLDACGYDEVDTFLTRISVSGWDK